MEVIVRFVICFEDEVFTLAGFPSREAFKPFSKNRKYAVGREWSMDRKFQVLRKITR